MEIGKSECTNCGEPIIEMPHKQHGTMWVHLGGGETIHGSSTNTVYGPCREEELGNLHKSVRNYAAPTSEYLAWYQNLMDEVDDDREKIRMALNDNRVNIYDKYWNFKIKDREAFEKDYAWPIDTGLKPSSELQQLQQLSDENRELRREATRLRNKILELENKILELEAERDSEKDLAEIEEVDDMLESID